MTNHAMSTTATPYLTKREAAEYAKVSERTIDRWVAEFGLESSKVGRTIRFHIADLETFLARHKGVR